MADVNTMTDKAAAETSRAWTYERVDPIQMMPADAGWRVVEDVHEENGTKTTETPAPVVMWALCTVHEYRLPEGVEYRDLKSEHFLVRTWNEIRPVTNDAEMGLFPHHGDFVRLLGPGEAFVPVA